MLFKMLFSMPVYIFDILFKIYLKNHNTSRDIAEVLILILSMYEY